MSKLVRGHVYRDDEEPEWSGYFDTEAWFRAIRGLCRFCGLTGHRFETCPNRPLNDFYQGPKGGPS